MRDPFVDVPARVAALGGSLGANYVHYASTSSTNDRAKESLREDAARTAGLREDAARKSVHGTVFVADAQEAGRGRQGRAWRSEPGQNLLFSVVYQSPIFASHPARRTLVPLATGLAVRNALASLGPREPRSICVKWPNDIIVQRSGVSPGGDNPGSSRRKLGGILVEAIANGLVIGIGVNVETTAFDSELAEVATSLRLLGSEASRADALVAILVALEHEVERVLAGGFSALRSRYEAAWCMQDAPVFVAGAESTLDGYAAVVRGIDDDGRLLVEDDAGKIHALNAGDVHLRNPPSI